MTIYQNDQPISEEAVKGYRRIHAAGGIVRNEKDEILLIFRLGKWDFPKGKVEEGEQFDQTAVREVEEETGLQNILLGEPLLPLSTPTNCTEKTSSRRHIGIKCPRTPKL